MAEESLHEGPERPLCKAMKTKPAVHWGLQHVRDNKPWDALQEGLLKDMEPSRGGGGAKVSKHERKEPSKSFDILHRDLHRDARLGVCPSVFQSCLGPIFPHYYPF